MANSRGARDRGAATLLLRGAESQHRKSLLLPCCGLVLLLPLLVTPASCISKLCLEKLWSSTTIYFQEHPAGKQAVIATQEGVLTLVSLPPLGTTTMTKKSTWLDLTGRVYKGSEAGLLSFAFHPNFLTNGRFFVSYICNGNKTASCKLPCGCDTATACKGAICTISTIISEFSANGAPATATALKTSEKVILAYGRPRLNHMGGHIFFGKDGYLYITSGDGGGQGDPFNMSQNAATFFGKIFRINVDQTAGSTNYVIPPDNPFQGVGQNPLTYAMGLRNAWRCDQDPASGTITCGDVGGDYTEEVNVIVPGGNYLWRNYEGTYYYKGSKQGDIPGITRMPFFQYNHTATRDCIIGGVYYANAGVNQCLKGMYIFNDANGPTWVLSTAAASNQPQSVTTCAKSRSSACATVQLSYTYSWGRDASGNVYVMGTYGMYRVASQSTCSLTC